jgi:hypothetical protein
MEVEMKRRRTIFAVLGVVVLLLACSLAYYLYGGSTAPAGQQPLVYLNSSNLSSLKYAFNGSSDSVRVLVMLSPT